MKRLIFVICAISILAPAGSAAAAPSPAKLQRQITSLKHELAALRGRVAALEADLEATRGDLVTLALFADCGDALLWDGWDAIVRVLGYDPGAPYDDTGSCAALGITRRAIPAVGHAAALRLEAARARMRYLP